MSEFLSTVSALRGGGNNTNTNNGVLDTEHTTLGGANALQRHHLEAAAPGGVRQQSQFSQAAAHVSKGIFLVSDKLEKLTQLARQRSLFNDPARQIDRLTSVIQQDLQTLNSELDVVEQFVREQKGIASSAPSADQGGGASDVVTANSQASSSAIVTNLKNKLATTTKSFADVLQIRTDNLKQQNSRRKQFDVSGGGGKDGSGGGDGGGGGGRAASASMADAPALLKRRGRDAFGMRDMASASTQPSSSSSPASTQDDGGAFDDGFGLAQSQALAGKIACFVFLFSFNRFFIVLFALYHAPCTLAYVHTLTTAHSLTSLYPAHWYGVSMDELTMCIGENQSSLEPLSNTTEFQVTVAAHSPTSLYPAYWYGRPQSRRTVPPVARTRRREHRVDDIGTGQHVYAPCHNRWHARRAGRCDHARFCQFNHYSLLIALYSLVPYQVGVITLASVNSIIISFSLHCILLFLTR
jgi:hypothetical protein